MTRVPNPNPNPELGEMTRVLASTNKIGNGWYALVLVLGRLSYCYYYGGP